MNNFAAAAVIGEMASAGAMRQRLMLIGLKLYGL